MYLTQYIVITLFLIFQNNLETKKASVKKQFQYHYEKKAAADSVKNSEEQKVKNALLSTQQAQLNQEKTLRWALYGGLLLVICFKVRVSYWFLLWVWLWLQSWYLHKLQAL